MIDQIQIYRPEAPIQWVWLKISGPDAQDFLHRITTAHVKILQPGQGTDACLLSANGKIEAAFTLWNTASAEYAMEFDAGVDGLWLTRTQQVLERYIFADKVAVEVASGLSALWVFNLGSETSENVLKTNLLPDGVRACDHGRTQYGRPWTVFLGTQQQLLGLENSWKEKRPVNEVPFEILERWRIEMVRPRLGMEIDETVIPLEVGMLDSISRTKGCYPGQEVIERISSQGSPPRRLVKLECQGALPKSGELILDSEGKEVGKITSVSANLCLGLLKKNFLEPGTRLRSALTQAELKILQVAPDA